jgi:signal transduction histidine kinase
MRVSLKTRIVLLLLAAQTLLLVLGFAGSLWYTRRQIKASLRANLNSHLSELLSESHENDDRPGTLEFDPALVPDREHGALYAVRDRGKLLAGNDDWLRAVNDPGREFFRFRWNGQNYYGGHLPHARVPDQDGNGPQLFADVMYAAPAEPSNAMFLRTAGVLFVLGLAILAGSCVASNWAVAKGLVPLRDLAAEAQHVDERQWKLQVGPEARTAEELSPLVTSLESLLERLCKAFERERQFLGDAAHELKTSLAIQQSTLQLADRDGLSATEYRNAIDAALTDTARTHSLVLRMLELARAESETAASEKQATSVIGTAITNVLAELEAFRRARNLQIRCHGDFSACVCGDEDRLATVWRNLLDNAIQHSPSGSTIEVDVSTSDSAVQVAIRDHGDGIPADHLPRVFERFYRSDSSRSRATGGFGLGLSIVRALVSRCGGTCDLTSEAGAGTVVTVTLPRTAIPQQGAPAPERVEVART